MRKARMMLGVVPLLTAICLFMGWVLPPPCFIKALTGLSCPSCGTWRSLGFLMKGDVMHAFAANPVFFYWDFLFGLFFVQASLDLAGINVNMGEKYFRCIYESRFLVVIHVITFICLFIYKNY